MIESSDHVNLTYAYDAKSLCLPVYDPPTQRTNFTYDAGGHPVAKRVDTPADAAPEPGSGFAFIGPARCSIGTDTSGHGNTLIYDRHTIGPVYDASSRIDPGLIADEPTLLDRDPPEE